MRKSMLTKSLSATLGSQAVYIPRTPEEQLIHDTEEKMIAGVYATEHGYWDGTIGHMSDIRFIQHKTVVSGYYKHYMKQLTFGLSYSSALKVARGRAAYLEAGYAAPEKRMTAMLNAPLRRPSADITIWDEMMSTTREVQAYAKVLGIDYAKADAQTTYFVFDSLRAIPAGSDEPQEPARCPHPGHQRRPGRQSTGPLRPGAVLQAARRRDGWHSR